MYVYLVRYAEEQQDLALLSISTFQRALKVSGSDKASAQLEERPSEKGDNNLLPASLWLGGVKGPPRAQTQWPWKMISVSPRGTLPQIVVVYRRTAYCCTYWWLKV